MNLLIYVCCSRNFICTRECRIESDERTPEKIKYLIFLYTIWTDSHDCKLDRFLVDLKLIERSNLLMSRISKWIAPKHYILIIIKCTKWKVFWLLRFEIKIYLIIHRPIWQLYYILKIRMSCITPKQKLLFIQHKKIILIVNRYQTS